MAWSPAAGGEPGLEATNAREAGRRETTRRWSRCRSVQTSSVGTTVAASAVEANEVAASTLTRARAAQVLLLSMRLDAGRGWVSAGVAGGTTWTPRSRSVRSRAGPVLMLRFD